VPRTPAGSRKRPTPRSAFLYPMRSGWRFGEDPFVDRLSTVTTYYLAHIQSRTWRQWRRGLWASVLDRILSVRIKSYGESIDRHCDCETTVRRHGMDQSSSCRQGFSHSRSPLSPAPPCGAESITFDSKSRGGSRLDFCVSRLNSSFKSHVGSVITRAQRRSYCC
jgi:hypothetical protein